MVHARYRTPQVVPHYCVYLCSAYTPRTDARTAAGDAAYGLVAASCTGTLRRAAWI